MQPIMEMKKKYRTTLQFVLLIYSEVALCQRLTECKKYSMNKILRISYLKLTKSISRTYS